MSTDSAYVLGDITTSGISRDLMEQATRILSEFPSLRTPAAPPQTQPVDGTTHWTELVHTTSLHSGPPQENKMPIPEGIQSAITASPQSAAVKAFVRGKTGKDVPDDATSDDVLQLLCDAFPAPLRRREYITATLTINETVTATLRRSEVALVDIDIDHGVLADMDDDEICDFIRENWRDYYESSHNWDIDYDSFEDYEDDVDINDTDAHNIRDEPNEE